VEKPGHSQKRDGLSPIPTDHRDGLGNAPRPPLCLEEVWRSGSKRRGPELGLEFASSGDDRRGMQRNAWYSLYDRMIR